MTNKYPFNRTLLDEILQIQTHSRECVNMQVMIWDFAESRNLPVSCDDAGNIYITKGESDTYPCIVAHMDTVHDITPGNITPVYVEANTVRGARTFITGINTMTMRQTGIGGDDKCGIYCALEALIHLPYAKAAFFVDEEIGCVGSYKADVSFFKDCRFILQADRRGWSDFVTDIFGGISSKEFQDSILPIVDAYGLNYVDGMMTDVQALRDLSVGISAANISAGYYNPHQDCEYIDVADLCNTCNLMLEICEKVKVQFPFTFTRKYNHRYMGNWGNYGWDHEAQWQGFSFPNEEEEEEEEGNYSQSNKDIHHKRIVDMTDAEWMQYQEEAVEADARDILDTIRDEQDALDKWYSKHSYVPTNPLV